MTSLSLRGFITHQDGGISPGLCWQMCYQLATTLCDVHEQGYTVGILDPANIRIMYKGSETDNKVGWMAKIGIDTVVKIFCL